MVFLLNFDGICTIDCCFLWEFSGQMIMAAIEGLNEEEGSSKLAISNYIESSYPDLPPAHSTLLSNTLEKLRVAGQLVFSNGNYMKADPNGAPAKRGRGRPPKPKDPLGEGVVSDPPRPRGRPPKSRDPLAPLPQPKKVSSGSGRPRGRPRKYPKEAATATAPAAAPGIKRGRGRPPKVKV